jgi:hypothetical protein
VSDQRLFAPEGEISRGATLSNDFLVGVQARGR